MRASLHVSRSWGAMRPLSSAAATAAVTVPPEGVAEAKVHPNGMAHIVLNREKVLNSLSLPMVQQIVTHLQGWATRADVKAVMFTGAGSKAFWCVECR